MTNSAKNAQEWLAKKVPKAGRNGADRSRQG
jgi:hypothetical protein